MPKCIFCGEEVENSKEHIAEKHLGINQIVNQAPQVAPTPAITQKNTTENTTLPQQDIIKPQKPDTPMLPMEKPKKRYLDADEIITLLQNTNKSFSLKDIAGCPITKEGE